MPRLRGIMSNLRDRSGDLKPERFCVLRSCIAGGRDILVCLMSDARRFLPPWTVEEQSACFAVRNAKAAQIEVLPLLPSGAIRSARRP